MDSDKDMNSDNDDWLKEMERRLWTLEFETSLVVSEKAEIISILRKKLDSAKQCLERIVESRQTDFDPYEIALKGLNELKEDI